MSSSSNFINTLSQDLRELGFTDYEARVYISLIQQSPVTAYEISKNNALPRPNVYTALENLERKHAVQKVSLDPVRYIPISPTILLNRIARTINEQCSSLQSRLEKIQPEDRTHYVWIINGADEASAKISELISNAKTHIWIKAHFSELMAHEEELRKALNRGVSILLILFGSKAETDYFQFSKKCTVFAHENDGTVVGFGRYLITLSIDFKEALIVNMERQTGAFTQSEPVVNLADSLIRHEIYLAEIFKRFGNVLEKEFGPALFNLRKKYLPADQAAELAQRIKSSKLVKK